MILNIINWRVALCVSLTLPFLFTACKQIDERIIHWQQMDYTGASEAPDSPGSAAGSTNIRLGPGQVRRN